MGSWSWTTTGASGAVLHGGVSLRARHFNWKKAGLPAGDMNPETHYLGNRPGPSGWWRSAPSACSAPGNRREISRVRRGLSRRGRKFGNLLDPSSEIRNVIENKRVFILKEDLNTHRSSTTSTPCEPRGRRLMQKSGRLSGVFPPGEEGEQAVLHMALRPSGSYRDRGFCVRQPAVQRADRHRDAGPGLLGFLHLQFHVRRWRGGCRRPARHPGVCLTIGSPIKEIAILGELVAVSAMVMCLLFVTVDIGRPDRFWHLIPRSVS